jgi:hypothetical protein
MAGFTRQSRRKYGVRSAVLCVFLFSCGLPVPAWAQPLAVRNQQGTLHGFLLLRSAEGKVIAAGDQVNVTRGNELHSRLVFHFKDGSIDDEVVVFRQSKVLALVSDHHIQRGPSFAKPLDMKVNVATRQVTWHERKAGKDQIKTEKMDIGADLANGLMLPILENFPEKAAEIKMPFVAGSKPRLLTLVITKEGEDPFLFAGMRRRATRFNIHIEIGGLAGMVAPLIGKQPDDIKVWLVAEEPPTFLRLEGALYEQGPYWTMELASPTWPRRAHD